MDVSCVATGSLSAKVEQCKQTVTSMGGGTRRVRVPGHHYVSRMGVENSRKMHFFAAFLLFRYKVHHLQNFSDCLTLSTRQAYPNTSISVTNQ